MMHNQARDDNDDEQGVFVMYYVDCGPFNQWRLQVYSKAQERLINNLLIMDDAAIVVYTEPSMQRITSCFCVRLAAVHVSRMEDHRFPKIGLYGELSTGHRGRGAQRIAKYSVINVSHCLSC